MSCTAIFIIVGVIAVLIFPALRASRAQFQDLPSFKREDIAREDRVAAYVDAFLQRDFQARQLLNPSNRFFFGQGYRPAIGVPHDPEAQGKRFTDIRSYFIRKLYLDLNAIQPLTQESLQAFMDQFGRYADQTVICAGEIAVKYDLKVQGRFNFRRELAKVPLGPEQEEFKRCWLNDFIVGTELRLIGWMYQQFFGVPYVIPEKR